VLSLRLRLTLLVACLNTGFLVTLTWLLVESHRASIRDEIEAAHHITVQMLGTTGRVSPVLGPTPVVMASFLQHLGHVPGSEIRFYSADNQLRYTSPAGTYKSGRQAPLWFQNIVRPALDATIINLPGARIEVIPDASKAMLDAWDTIVVVEMLGLCFIAVLHIALLFLLRHLLRPTEADARRLVTTTRELAENRVVTRMIQAGIEDERKRLARELHDELGQSITAIRLIAATLERAGGKTSAEDAAAKIDAIAASLYDNVHRIVRELRPTALEQRDLAAALHDLARGWQDHHPKIMLTTDITGDLSDLSEPLALAVFRCVQEALTNALKHSAASQIDLSVLRQDEVLEVTVSDDGPLAPDEPPGMGHGLMGMRERITAFGGYFEAGRRQEGGFRVAIRVPVTGG